MKFLLPVHLTLIFTILFMNPTYSEELRDLYKDYFESKLPEVTETFNEGDIFSCKIYCMNKELLTLESIVDGYKKRFTENKIFENAKLCYDSFEQENNIQIVTEFSIIGELNGSIEFQDDFKDYIFLENINGVFTRCKNIEFIATKVELIEGQIYNPRILNKTSSVKFKLTFDKIDDNGKDILKNTNVLYIKFKKHFGEDYTVQFLNQFSKSIFGDAPYQLDNIMKKIKQ